MNAILKDYCIFYALSALFFCACLPNSPNRDESPILTDPEVSFPYNLNMPHKSWWLPHILQEISGIAFVTHNKIACIQDEKGKVYIFDLDSSQIIEEHKFAKDADFEDIEYHDGSIQVLESSGKLFQLAFPFNNQKTQTLTRDLDKSLDYEGLCYSAQTNTYLLAAKKSEVLFDVDISLNNAIKRQIVHNYNNNKLKASGITMDTLSHNIYILSSVNKSLLILDLDFNLLSIKKLNSKIFKQPEGICLSSTGDLYISNEGQNGKANILQFKRTHEQNH